jgi:thiamine-phosphate pyrophosphorylase
MKLVVISLPTDPPREREVLSQLFAAGLERYHLRKPDWSREAHLAWLREIPKEWRARMLIHFHQELAVEMGLGGVHWRSNSVGRGVPAEPSRIPSANAIDFRSGIESAAQPEASPYPYLTSRSCHSLPSLQESLGHYDSVFFGPLYPSISKPGYGPQGEFSAHEIAAVLGSRSAAERRTSVLGLSGITIEHLPQIRALGLDGIAVIGAIWNAPDPLRAFNEFQDALCCHAA